MMSWQWIGLLCVWLLVAFIFLYLFHITFNVMPFVLLLWKVGSGKRPNATCLNEYLIPRSLWKTWPCLFCCSCSCYRNLIWVFNVYVLGPMSWGMCNLYLCCSYTDVSEQSALYMLRGTWFFHDINISLSCIVSCLIYVSCHRPIREHPHVRKYSAGHMVSRWTKLWAGQPRNCCWIPNRSQRFVSFPKPPDCLWSPPFLLFSSFQGLLLGVKWPGEKATSHCRLVMRLRVHGAMCFHGMHSICTFVLCCCQFYGSHSHSSNMQVLQQRFWMGFKFSFWIDHKNKLNIWTCVLFLQSFRYCICDNDKESKPWVLLPM